MDKASNPDEGRTPVEILESEIKNLTKELQTKQQLWLNLNRNIEQLKGAISKLQSVLLRLSYKESADESKKD